jgi:hypothetical protein
VKTTYIKEIETSTMITQGVNVYQQLSKEFNARSHNTTDLTVPHTNEPEWMECTMATFKRIMREDTYKVGGLDLG